MLRKVDVYFLKFLMFLRLQERNTKNVLKRNHKTFTEHLCQHKHAEVIFKGFSKTFKNFIGQER